MKIGETWFSVKSLLPFEVVRETDGEFYLCRFDGSSSEVDVVPKRFPSGYAKTEITAATYLVSKLREQIKSIETIYMQEDSQQKKEIMP